jgi:hypothetical protein
MVVIADTLTLPNEAVFFYFRQAGYSYNLKPKLYLRLS